MRLARFQRQGRTAYGIVYGAEIEEVSGSIFEHAVPTGTRHSLSAVKLLPPVEPLQSWGPGMNFPSHLAAGRARQLAAERAGEQVAVPTAPASGPGANFRNFRAKALGSDELAMPVVPEPWQKGVGSAVIGDGDAIVIPFDAVTGVQYEGECVAVIRRTVRRVSSEQAWESILGYTCGNDVSERTWQRGDWTFWRGKGADTFSPIGPWIETDLDPRKGCEMLVRLNGKEVQHGNTRDMHFDFGKLVSYISQWVTMHPGDLVWSGTSGSAGSMTPGDVVEVEVEGIGALRNTVTQESPHNRPTPGTAGRNSLRRA